jgi:hypothetical protein
MELDTLLQQAERGEYVPMQPGDYDPSLAYWYGELAVEKVGWSPDLNLHDLLVRCGGTIHYIDYAAFRLHPDIFTNSIYFRESDDFDIILPAHARMAENRLTMAHEIGHYVLHAKRSGKSYALRNGNDLVDQQADCFAMGFLLPSQQFHMALEQYQTEYELALAFRVPESVILARLQSLEVKLNQ